MSNCCKTGCSIKSRCNTPSCDGERIRVNNYESALTKDRRHCTCMNSSRPKPCKPRPCRPRPCFDSCRPNPCEPCRPCCPKPCKPNPCKPRPCNDACCYKEPRNTCGCHNDFFGWDDDVNGFGRDFDFHDCDHGIFDECHRVKPGIFDEPKTHKECFYEDERFDDYMDSKPDCGCHDTCCCEKGHGHCDESCHDMNQRVFADKPLAMAYVPKQHWDCILDTDEGFCKGTIFEELYKPFKGGEC